ncbi:ribonuclease HI [Curvivirga sp.]|uniref:ribonuclease HI n=1 Tax=Curvivirga sp. TaxID=2856848 RepID=UPI003B596263
MKATDDYILSRVATLWDRPYEDHVVDVYIDGSCEVNPGIGGWGVFALHDAKYEILYGGGDREKTTNQRMELTAAIKALKHFSSQSNYYQLTIYSDSKYVVDGITNWIYGWKMRGWVNSQGKPVANEDLWQELDRLVCLYSNPINWQWVKGHSGNTANEISDQLARIRAKTFPDCDTAVFGPRGMQSDTHDSAPLSHLRQCIDLLKNETPSLWKNVLAEWPHLADLK